MKKHIRVCYNCGNTFESDSISRFCKACRNGEHIDLSQAKKGDKFICTDGSVLTFERITKDINNDGLIYECSKEFHGVNIISGHEKDGWSPLKGYGLVRKIK